MKSKRNISASAQKPTRAGAMLVLIGLCLPVIIAFGVFAINVAWMQLTRTELRTATDASVKASSRVLSLSQSPALARQWGVDAAARNTVAGSPLIVRPSEVVFGSSSVNGAGGYDFTAQPDSSETLTSVQVLGSRGAGSASGPIPLLFNGLFDQTTFEPQKIAVATQIDRDVALVLDRSGSMNSRSGSGSRWDALENAVDGFLDELSRTPQDEQVAICTYSTSSRTDENLSLDYGRLRATVRRVRLGGWTAIGMGMQSGMQTITNPLLARPLAAKTIVVMTDGNHNRGIAPETVAAQAAAQGITVHTITFSGGANKFHMQQVATNGAGRHWHADDVGALETVFREVANNLPTLLTH